MNTKELTEKVPEPLRSALDALEGLSEARGECVRTCAQVKASKAIVEANATLAANEGKDNAETRAAKLRIDLSENAEYVKAVELEYSAAASRDRVETELEIARFVCGYLTNHA